MPETFYKGMGVSFCIHVYNPGITAGNPVFTDNIFIRCNFEHFFAVLKRLYNSPENTYND